MNPALAVKLRPTGPWRIGSDSGARNRVDSCLHSDALYSAVTSALALLGPIEEWLDATARAADSPRVAFSSCFPFMDGIDFVVPPRTIWPPVSMGGSRVRWKSARFAPVSLVRSMVAGRRPDESHWSVDGPSGCLIPTGSPGPFRTSVRWSAAVDRMTGSAERHSIACLEFRPGAGLWAVVSFASEAARDRWQEPVKAAFRLLADGGFGGERSRGWGRSEAPEFTEGTLPSLILPLAEAEGPRAGGQGTGEPKSAPEPVEQVPDLPSGADLQVCPPESESLPEEKAPAVPSEGEAEQPVGASEGEQPQSEGEAEQPASATEAEQPDAMGEAAVEADPPEPAEAAVLAPQVLEPLTAPEP
jgi:CRISPR type III-A-associated RAMP protein Csm4